MKTGPQQSAQRAPVATVPVFPLRDPLPSLTSIDMLARSANKYVNPCSKLQSASRTDAQMLMAVENSGGKYFRKKEVWRKLR